MISVIIPTRDRANKLTACLRALENARRPASPVEVVVVDNGSEDATPAVCDAWAGSLPTRFVRETRRGLSRAKNRGLVEARGDVVVFVDDDCVVSEDWLEVLSAEFQDPELDACGGRVELLNPLDAPVSIRTSAVRELVWSADQLLGGLPGCNLAVRRSMIDRAGAFDHRLGPGTANVAGEDTDFIWRMMRAGGRLFYVPDLLLYHDHGRRGPTDILAVNRGYVRGRGAFYCKHVLRGSVPIAKMAVRELASLSAEALRLSPRRRANPAAGERLFLLGRGMVRYLSMLWR